MPARSGPVLKTRAPLLLFPSRALCSKAGRYVLFPRRTTIRFDERATVPIIKANSVPDAVSHHSMDLGNRPVRSSLLRTVRMAAESTHTRIRLGFRD